MGRGIGVNWHSRKLERGQPTAPRAGFLPESDG